MKKFFLISLAFFLVAIWVNSCQSPTSPDRAESTPLAKPNSESSSSTLSITAIRDLNSLLRESNEVQELTAIWKDLRNRALSSGMPWQELMSAYQRQDEQLLRNSLGLTSQEEVFLNNRLRELTRSLLSKFPELQAFVKKAKPCINCGSAEVIGKVDILTAPEGCHWIQYTAALVVCSAGGPVLYWPCAYLAYCSLCWGDIHDAICSN